MRLKALTYDFDYVKVETLKSSDNLEVLFLSEMRAFFMHGHAFVH
jgi:hypothetical protein